MNKSKKMSEHFHIINIFFVVNIILWSLLADDYLENRLTWGIINHIICFLALPVFFLFIDQSKFSIPKQYLYSSLVLLHIGILFLYFHWSGNYSWTSNLNIVGSILVLFAHLPFLIYFQYFGTANRLLGLFSTSITFFIFLVSLTETQVEPYYFFPIISLYVPCIIILYFAVQEKVDTTFYVLQSLLLGSFLILLGRRWNSESSMPYYLIIQPVIAACTIQGIKIFRS